MARLLHHDLFPFWRKGCKYCLAFAWCFGLFFGMVFSFSAGDSLILLMSGAADAPGSIVSLLMTIALPFLLSAFAVYISAPGLLLIAAFGKAFLFSFVSLGAFRAFGDSGWLVYRLLLFSDICSLPGLYWFWHRHISGERKLSAADLLVPAIAGSAVLLDYYWVSPLLAELI